MGWWSDTIAALDALFDVDTELLELQVENEELRRRQRIRDLRRENDLLRNELDREKKS
jgi:hypothetical protein